MRVAYYSLDPSDPTAFYRTSGVLPYINHKEIELIDISNIKLFDWHLFAGIDKFIIQRPFSNTHQSIIKLAKDMGVYVIADYDDDLLNVDQYNPTYEMYLLGRDSTKICINLCDELWVSTQSIKESYGHPNTKVIPNAHNDYVFKIEDKKQFANNNKVFWRGGESHKADILYQSEFIIDLINSTEYQYYFCGARFTELEMRCGDNLNVIPAQTIIQFYKYMHHENPQAFIFPLQNTLFNRGKSNISWLEATYSGSAFFGNTNLPEFNFEYILPLERMSRTPISTMEMMNTQSWDYIKENLLLSKVNKQRVKYLLNGI